jgi:hypothetical protein
MHVGAMAVLYWTATGFAARARFTASYFCHLAVLTTALAIPGVLPQEELTAARVDDNKVARLQQACAKQEQELKKARERALESSRQLEQLRARLQQCQERHAHELQLKVEVSASTCHCTCQLANGQPF